MGPAASLLQSSHLGSRVGLRSLYFVISLQLASTLSVYTFKSIPAETAY